ncbi:MAG: hypothetical protein U0838_07895 [Chloroflexota bacterium]
MTETRVTAPAGLPFIEVERAFDAPRDLVFRAWTDPAARPLARAPPPADAGGLLGARRARRQVPLHQLGRTAARSTPSTARSTARPRTLHAAPDLRVRGFPGYVSLDELKLVEDGGRTIAKLRSVHQTVEARDGMVQSGMQEGMDDGFDKLDELLAGELAAAR